eukprot:1074799-Rhodomonas_salina.2
MALKRPTTDLPYSATALTYGHTKQPLSPSLSSASSLAYHTPTVLRTPYALSGTDLAYAATRLVPNAHLPVAAYAIAMRYAVLSSPKIAYGTTCYAMCGTELAYAMRYAILR